MATYKNSIFDARFICMGRLGNARETWIKRRTAILVKGLSPNDTRSFWLWSALISP
jgi:hypothetical protein